MITHGIDAQIAHRMMHEEALMRGLARRFAGDFGRGRSYSRRRAGGPTPPAPFPDFTLGTFDRESEASQRTGAGAFIWVGNDVLRADDAGDGYGPQYLFEASATQKCQQSKTLSGTGWTVGGTFAADQTTGPDGLTDADKLTSTGAGQTAGRLLYTTGATSTPLVASVWVKIGTQGNKVSIRAGAANSADFTPTSTWQRISHAYTGGSVVAENIVIWNLWGGSAGTGVTGDNHFYASAQIETGRYPSSTMRALGGTFTRLADVLTFTQAQIPTWFFSAGWTARVWPRFAETEIVSGETRNLFSMGDANNLVRIRHNGTDVRVAAVQAGTVRASSNAISSKARHALWTVGVDPVNGRVSVDGVNGSAGTAWSWSANNVRVGGIYGDAGEADCRIEKPVVA